MADRRSKKSEITRSESAYEIILSAVIFGDLAPGSAADEKRIAARFGLGLAGVREALYRLSLEGLVQRQPRIGTRIPDLGLREMQCVFEARVVLEGSCAALAAERATPAELTLMGEAFNGYLEAINERDFRRLVRMDQVFHRTMAAASRNEFIERQVVTLHNNASRFWYYGLPRLDPAALRQDIETHRKVVEAMQRRDPFAAQTAMQAVLSNFPDYVQVFLSSPILHSEEQTNARSETDRWQRKRSQRSARTTEGIS